MKTIAFDCDGTLQDYTGKPRPTIIEMVKLYKAAGYKVVVWSGGGKDYAEEVARKVGIDDIVDEAQMKNLALKPDIAVDDEKVRFAPINIQIPC